MSVIVFDLGGTLMEYVGMPHSWADYYEQGFANINDKFRLNKTAADIARSVELLKTFNPRVQYREEEYSPEYIFSRVLEHWRTDIDVTDCVYAFYEGLRLNAVIYPDTLPVLRELKTRKHRIAALTDLPTAMPDELFKKDIAELLEYIDLYVSSSSCGFRKPNCTGLRLIAEHFDVPITELIFVGDEEKDRKTSENACCKFIRIDRKSGDGIRDLYELLDMSDQHVGKC